MHLTYRVEEINIVIAAAVIFSWSTSRAVLIEEGVFNNFRINNELLIKNVIGGGSRL
ncbi:hypothetical protein [Bacillus sp. UNC438CL73TsuS30]|uniref:hypothetical protein n=1 Tax=Bacillus sp. UNC438CL73TsuS30 TaxID=1340434 RepID=UPI000B2C0484|nr:hypothetical protein [Bacillus sp. UNC438CL73TsuS30]